MDLRRFLQAGADDALAPHRERVMYALSLLAIAGLLPFALNDFVQGRPVVGVAILCVVATVGIDAWAIHRGRRPPIPFALLIVPMAIGMAAALHQQGVIAALWCYPTVLFIFFVLSRRLANLCGLALLIGGTALVDRYVGHDFAVRFAVTLALLMISFNIILNVISQLQRQLLDQAATDPLTGLFNRRRMVERLQAAAAQEKPGTLLVIDVDRFKPINDRFGHEAGDAVLTGVVALLRAQCGPQDELFRMGGDEFVMILHGLAVGEATARAEQLRQSVAAAPLLRQEPVSVSIGVAGLRPRDTLDTWMRRADDALYEAKRAGRNCVGRAREAA